MSGLLREGRYWLAKVLDLFPEPSSRERGWALACRCYLGAMQGTAAEAVADGTAGTEIGIALGDMQAHRPRLQLPDAGADHRRQVRGGARGRGEGGADA